MSIRFLPSQISTNVQRLQISVVKETNARMFLVAIFVCATLDTRQLEMDEAVLVRILCTPNFFRSLTFESFISSAKDVISHFFKQRRNATLQPSILIGYTTKCMWMQITLKKIKGHHKILFRNNCKAALREG